MGQPGGGNLVSLNQADDRNAGEQPADGNQQSNSQTESVAPPVKQSPGPNKPADAQNEARTEQPNPLQVRDVAAQEDMVFWAAWMFAAAFATLLVTSLGTIAIWRQVNLTRKAVQDTGEATEAMREANVIAKEATEKQLRPWLEIVIEPHGDFVWDKRRATLNIKVTINNRGNSPATNVMVSAKLSGESSLPAPEDMRKALGQVEEVLDSWDASKFMGTPIFPKAKEGPKDYSPALYAHEVSAIRKTHPQNKPFYMLAVGVRYQFGDRSARTTVSYFVRGTESIDYDQPGTIKAEGIVLEDSFNGYAT